MKVCVAGNLVDISWHILCKYLSVLFSVYVFEKSWEKQIKYKKYQKRKKSATANCNAVYIYKHINSILETYTEHNYYQIVILYK